MRRLVLVLWLAAGVIATPAAQPSDETSQLPPLTDPRTSAILRVFLDCRACDENYLRTEITFVDYVRDRTQADVHLLITTQSTGGGGTEYSLKFIGLGRFHGHDDALTYAAPQTNTSDETRRELVETVKLGLVHYVAQTSVAPRLRVTYDAPEQPGVSRLVRDPWKFWVFRIGASSSFEGESTTSEKGGSASFSANRTTDEWKINFNASGRYNQERFELEEGEIFTSISRNIEGRLLVTKSLTPHWSYGGTGAFQSSIFQNYDARTRFAPGIEYNIFPYAESTRRILTLFYSLGLQTADYREETIYGKFEETLLDHEFEASLGMRQPWGSASASFEIQHYLSQTDKYRINAFGSMDVRLFKGFSLDVYGNVARRRDQLSLRRGDATTEEILVRQRELATGYQYEIGFGVSYSFGSIFNNVVNPRFRNVGGW